MGIKDEFFEELYEKYFSSIYKFLYRMTFSYEDAGDIAQEVFFEAYRKRIQLMDHPNVKGWLYVTASYKYKQYMAKKQTGVSLETLEDVLPGPERSRLDYTEFQTILKDEELRLLVNYYEYGYSLDQIASAMHISKPALKMRLQRIIKKVKKHYQ